MKETSSQRRGFHLTAKHCFALLTVGYDPGQFWEKGLKSTPDLFKNLVSKLLLPGACYLDALPGEAHTFVCTFSSSY